MLNRMHTKSGKRFNVSIAMVNGMNVLVHCLDVKKPEERWKLAVLIHH